MSSPFLLAQETTEAPKPAETTGDEAAPPAKPAETTPAVTGETTGQGETGTKSEQPLKPVEEKPPSGFFGGPIWLPLVMILVLMYFVLFRPQRKQEKKRREMLSIMEKNNRVVTVGGIHGIIYSVGDTDVVLKIDERNDIRIRVAKSHIGRVLAAGDEEEEAEQASRRS